MSRKLDLCGKVIPGLELKITNLDEDGIGEILLKGESVTKGYFGNELKTKEVIIDDWLHTGDLGRIDEDEFLYIYGRNNDVIVLSNGKKVFPVEIEVKLDEIGGVRESLVFKNDNKINAKIVYISEYFENKTDDEIYNTIMDKVRMLNKSLPQYKRINSVVVTSKELEKTVTGKIKRNLEHTQVIGENILNDSKNDRFEKLKEILAYKLGREDISKEADIVLDLGADSLDMVEIFLLLEKEFNIEIGKEQRKKVVKVEDLLDIISI